MCPSFRSIPNGCTDWMPRPHILSNIIAMNWTIESDGIWNVSNENSLSIVFSPLTRNEAVLHEKNLRNTCEGIAVTFQTCRAKCTTTNICHLENIAAIVSYVFALQPKYHKTTKDLHAIQPHWLLGVALVILINPWSELCFKSLWIRKSQWKAPPEMLAFQNPYWYSFLSFFAM